MKYYKEKDKDIAAFFLICKNLKFQGTEPVDDILYFLFSPLEKAEQLANLFLAKQTDPVQPKDYAEAQETITELIWKWRKQRDLRNGGSYDHK